MVRLKLIPGEAPPPYSIGEGSGQLYGPGALLAGKEPSVPTEQEALWGPQPVQTRWQREEFLPLLGNEPT